MDSQSDEGRRSEDAGVNDEPPAQQQQQHQDGSGASGEGAASAYARMKSQHDRRARQQPADEPGHGRRHD